MLSRWLFSLSWQETSAGRNLITLFPTVNNPGEFFFAPPAAPARPARERASSANACARRASRERISIASLKPKRGAGFGAFAFFFRAHRSMRARVRRRVRRARGDLYRKKKFRSADAADFAPHKPECAKVRKLFSTVDDRRSALRRRWTRSTASAADARADAGDGAGGEVRRTCVARATDAARTAARDARVDSGALERGARAATAVGRGCREAVGTRAARRRDARAKRYAKVADARGTRRRRSGGAVPAGAMRASAAAIDARRRQRSARSRMPARSRPARGRIDAADAGADAPAHDGDAVFSRAKSTRMRKRSRAASGRPMPASGRGGIPKPARRASH
ncbi:hypothetical protein [Lysobacter enzymogenes]|uniref:hypothetical protein n=1 Tax=Lysobacter enzymogenes TaxID=69 RepID=UPI0011AB6CFE|nr:hypothetical protein [Lysobacter enzymogenes]